MSEKLNEGGEDWENLSWAEQAFYFGYAKYYGVSVDVDRKMGLTLLKQAADLESTDAILALITIYENEDDENADEREAIYWRERQADVHRHLYGMTDKRTLMALGNLAHAYSLVEDYEKARAINEPLLELRRSVLGETHPDTLVTMNNLAYAYGKLGERQLAAQMEERLLDIRREAAGGDVDEDTLHTMNNLAVTYGQLGEHRRSYEMLEKVLAGRIRLLGEEDPETLTTMNNLAVAAAELGENARAIEMFEKIVAIRTRVSGYDHFDTAIARNNLGYTLCDIGEYERALAIHEELYKMRLAKYGKMNTNTLASMNNIGLVYEGEGRFEEALAMHIESGERIGRIQLGDANALAYKFSENSYEFAIKYLGVRRAMFSIERTNDGVNGKIYEYLTVSSSEIGSCAEFYITDNYVSVVGNKADNMIGFTGYINELYDATNGRMLGYEVKETLSSIVYNNLYQLGGI